MLVIVTALSLSPITLPVIPIFLVVFHRDPVNAKILSPLEPDEPLVPLDPSDPDVPEEPELPFEPEAPEEPELPFEPDVPELPFDPDVPEEPELPFEPDVPELPFDPDVPEEPLEPEEPLVPDDPAIAKLATVIFLVSPPLTIGNVSPDKGDTSSVNSDIFLSAILFLFYKYFHFYSCLRFSPVSVSIIPLSSCNKLKVSSPVILNSFCVPHPTKLLYNIINVVTSGTDTITPSPVVNWVNVNPVALPPPVTKVAYVDPTAP